MKLLKTYKEKCTGCHTCMSVCSKLYFKQDSPEKSCIRVSVDPESGFTLNVCNQCQRCVAECPSMAISVNKLGVVLVNKTLCIGCLACVAVCPTHSMRNHHDQIHPFKCIACGACAKECPAGALEIVTEEDPT